MGKNPIYGNNQANVLIGTDQDDDIQGYGGDDQIDAKGGVDDVSGGAGDDVIIGGLGGDVISGDDGKDTIHGGAGTERIFGGKGDDIIYGGDDYDTIEGNEGDDAIYGEGGNDFIKGNEGNDALSGGAGNDGLLSGDAGSDTYVFGRGYGVDMIDNYSRGYQTEIDTLQMDTGVGYQNLWFTKQDNNLIISVLGTGDQVKVQNWFLPGHPEYKLDKVRLIDGSEIDTGKIEDLVDRMKDVTKPGGDSIQPPLLGDIGNIWGITPNHPPVPNGSIGDLRVSNEAMVSIPIPGNLFTDPDNDPLTLTFRLSNSNSLPGWLTYNATTGVLEGDPPDDFAGDLDIQIIASDDKGATAQVGFKLTIFEPNHPPVNNQAIPDYDQRNDRRLSWSVPRTAFVDPDNDPLSYTYKLSNGDPLPSWIIPSSGNAGRTLTGRPPADFVGELEIIVTATDPFGEHVSQEFKLNVYDPAPNLSPQLVNPLDDVAYRNVPTFTWALPDGTFVDPDTPNLQYSYQLANGDPLPSWLVPNAAGTALQGNPPKGTDVDLEIQITAFDGRTRVTDTFIMEVERAANNRPYVNSAIPNVEFDNDVASFTWTLPADTFVDPDVGDELTYSYKLSNGQNLPSWLTVSPDGTMLTGYPTSPDQQETLRITVTATDQDGASTSDTFDLRVTEVNPNRQPEQKIIVPDQDILVGQPFQLQLPAGMFVDPDGDPLTWSVTKANGDTDLGWLTFDEDTRTLVGTPPSADADLELFISVTDGITAPVRQLLSIDVVEANVAPVVGSDIGDATVPPGTNFQIVVPADAFTDPNVGDVLTYRLTQLDGSAVPDWVHMLTRADGSRLVYGTAPNTAGHLDLKLTATDPGNLSAAQEFWVNYGAPNPHAPYVVTNIPDQEVHRNVPEILTIPPSVFADPDPGDSIASINVTLADATNSPLPGWIEWDDGRHQLTINPTLATDDDVTIRITATDTTGLSASQDVLIDVVNNPPEVAVVLPTQRVQRGKTVDLPIPKSTFTDPDPGDSIASIDVTLADAANSPLPTWIVWDPGNEKLVISPSATDDDVTVRVTATDNYGAKVYQDVMIDTFGTINTPPTVGQTIPDQTIYVGDTLALPIPTDAFIDPDVGDSLTYTVTLPNGDPAPGWVKVVNNDSLVFEPKATDADVTIRLTATDQAGASAYQDILIDANVTPPGPNNPPISALTIPDYLNGREGASFVIGVVPNTFVDPDVGDTVSLSLQMADGSQVPSWVRNNLGAADVPGMIYAYSIPAGTQPMEFRVVATDNHGDSTYQDVQLVIGGNWVNHAPEAVPPAPAVNATGKVAVNQDLSGAFVDNDISVGDSLVYSLRAKAGGAAVPAWLQIDAATGRVSGTPSNRDVTAAAGILLELVATDEKGLSAAQDLSVVVARGANTDPESGTSIGTITAPAGQETKTPLPNDAFTDDDGDSLTYGVEPTPGGTLPPWITIDQGTGEITVNPGAGDQGNYTFVVTATDPDGSKVSQDVTVDVGRGAGNNAPVPGPAIGTIPATGGVQLQYTVPNTAFTDPDHDTLTYTLEPVTGGTVPGWLTIDSVTGVITGDPTNREQGQHPVIIRADDGHGGTADQDVIVDVARGQNNYPASGTVIGTIPATGGQDIGYTLPAGAFTDADGDALTYTPSATGQGQTMPGWLHVDSSTGAMTGIPPNSEDGKSYTFTLTADDGHGGTVSQDVTIQVTGRGNNEPKAGTMIPDIDASAQTQFVQPLPANAFTDADDDPLTYSIELVPGQAGTLPTWLTINQTTGELSGTPTNADVGKTWNVRVLASDGQPGSTPAYQDVLIDVIQRGPNNDPEFNQTVAIGPVSATGKVPLDYDLPVGAASDPDLDRLTFSLLPVAGGSLPAWLQIDPLSGSLSGTPSNKDVGTFDVVLQVADGFGGTDTRTVQVSVSRGANTNPVIDQTLADQSYNQGMAIDYSVANAFKDDDGDNLTVTAQLVGGGALPSWLRYDAQSKKLVAAAGASQVGTWSVELTANDGYGGIVSQDVDLTVSVGNAVPQIDVPMPAQETTNGLPFRYKIPDNAFRDDDPTLVIAASNLPSWLRYDSAHHVLEGTVPAGASGSYYIDVSATDPQNQSATAQLEVKVLNPNDFVVINDTDLGKTIVPAPADQNKRHFIHGGGGNDTIYGTAQVDVLFGDDGRDTLYGNDGNDYLFGLNDGDSLNGGAGDDMLTGGVGDGDRLSGDTGNDLYRFGRGDGKDSISQATAGANDKDTVEFIADGGAIGASQLWFAREGADLMVKIMGTNDSLRLENWYGQQNPGLTFVAGGEELAAADVQRLVEAMALVSPTMPSGTSIPSNDPAYSDVRNTIAAVWN